MIPKEFRPNISKSYYLTRSLLLKAMEKHSHDLYCRNIMDFGAGSSPYKDLFLCLDYTTVDFEGKGHDHSQEKIDVFWNGKKLPFEDGKFSNIISTEVFEHIFNLPETLKELHRVIKEHGYMLVTCPFVIAEHEQPNHFANYTEYGIKHLLKQAGFTITYYEKIGTSIQSQMQMFMSYLDSYVICKFKRIGLYDVVVPIVFTILNLWTMFLNFILPKRYDAFLNHVIICQKL
jgi:SAM-dependent methyltransferase